MAKQKKSLEEQILDEVISKSVEAGFWSIRRFGLGVLHFIANLFFGILGMVFVPGDASFPIYGLAFSAGFLLLPALRRISDRL